MKYFNIKFYDQVLFSQVDIKFLKLNRLLQTGLKNLKSANN